MSNPNYINTRRTLTREKVLAEFQAVVKQFFGDKMTVIPSPQSKNEWYLDYSPEYPAMFYLRFENKHRVVTSEAHYPYFTMWVEGTVRHELARRWNGWLSCDDRGLGTWKPDAKAKTMLQWAARYGGRRGCGLRGEFEAEARIAPQTRVLKA